MKKLILGLASAVVATGFAGMACAVPVQNVASGSVAALPSGSGQVFNTLLLNPDANRSNYLVFDLSELAAGLGGLGVASATLTLTNPGLYQTGNASETYTLWDFSGDVDALRNYTFGAPPSGAAAAAVRDDLRGGTSFGSVVIGNPAPGALGPVSIVLNAAGIAALNGALASSEQYFAIGGYADIAGSPFQYLFNASVGSGPNASTGGGNAMLDVQAATVPAPAAFWLLGGGLLGIGAARRRRTASAA